MRPMHQVALKVKTHGVEALTVTDVSVVLKQVNVRS